jgi:hypothetical protein
LLSRDPDASLAEAALKARALARRDRQPHATAVRSR